MFEQMFLYSLRGSGFFQVASVLFFSVSVGKKNDEFLVMSMYGTL